jgi:hypothetical protein
MDTYLVLASRFLLASRKNRREEGGLEEAKMMPTYLTYKTMPSPLGRWKWLPFIIIWEDSGVFNQDLLSAQ